MSGGRWRAWRCLLLGPSRAELLARHAELVSRLADLRMYLDRSNARRNEALRELKSARSEGARRAWEKATPQIALLQRQVHVLHQVIERQWLAEPEQGEACVKVRLHTKAEAEAWAVTIAQRMGLALEDLTTYQCKACPRHPATTARFWHVASVTKEISTASRARGRARFRRAKQEGTLLEQRVELPDWVRDL